MKNPEAAPKNRYVVFTVFCPSLLIACPKQRLHSPELAGKAFLQGEMQRFEALGTLPARANLGRDKGLDRDPSRCGCLRDCLLRGVSATVTADAKKPYRRRPSHDDLSLIKNETVERAGSGATGWLRCA